MLEVIAINITNLTDARYFSARGAQWIFYGLKSLEDIPKIRAIIPWVDGPQYGIMTNQEWKEEELKFLIEQLEPAALLVKKTIGIKTDLPRFLMTKSIPKNVISKHILESESLENLPKNGYLFKKNWSEKDIDQIRKIKAKGLVFTGSKEEKPGIRSYELIDKVLDQVEEVNYD